MGELTRAQEAALRLLASSSITTRRNANDPTYKSSRWLVVNGYATEEQLPHKQGEVRQTTFRITAAGHQYFVQRADEYLALAKLSASADAAKDKE